MQTYLIELLILSLSFLAPVFLRHPYEHISSSWKQPSFLQQDHSVGNKLQYSKICFVFQNSLVCAIPRLFHLPENFKQNLRGKLVISWNGRHCTHHKYVGSTNNKWYTKTVTLPKHKGPSPKKPGSAPCRFSVHIFNGILVHNKSLQTYLAKITGYGYAPLNQYKYPGKLHTMTIQFRPRFLLATLLFRLLFYSRAVLYRKFYIYYHRMSRQK